MNKIEENLKKLAGEIVTIRFNTPTLKMTEFGHLKYLGNDLWECDGMTFHQNLVREIKDGIRHPEIHLKAGIS